MPLAPPFPKDVSCCAVQLSRSEAQHPAQRPPLPGPQPAGARSVPSVAVLLPVLTVLPLLCPCQVWSPRAAKRTPPVTRHAFSLLFQSFFYLFVHLTLANTFNVRGLTSNWFKREAGSAARLGYLCALAFTQRAKFYFAWLLAEAAATFSEFNFIGYDAKGRPEWCAATVACCFDLVVTIAMLSCALRSCDHVESCAAAIAHIHAGAGVSRALLQRFSHLVTCLPYVLFPSAYAFVPVVTKHCRHSQGAAPHAAARSRCSSETAPFARVKLFKVSHGHKRQSRKLFFARLPFAKPHKCVTMHCAGAACCRPLEVELQDSALRLYKASLRNYRLRSLTTAVSCAAQGPRCVLPAARGGAARQRPAAACGLEHRHRNLPAPLRVRAAGRRQETGVQHAAADAAGVRAVARRAQRLLHVLCVVGGAV